MEVKIKEMLVDDFYQTLNIKTVDGKEYCVELTPVDEEENPKK